MAFCHWASHGVECGSTLEKSTSLTQLDLGHMLLTSKGKSHRDLLPNQETLQIATVSGSLTQTERRTRDFTDRWKNNLLKQKPYNENGVQYGDPMLNRDIVKVRGESYKKHIKLEGKKCPGKNDNQSNNRKKSSDDYYHTPLLLEVYRSQQEESSGDRSNGTRDALTAITTPHELDIGQKPGSGENALAHWGRLKHRYVNLCRHQLWPKSCADTR